MEDNDLGFEPEVKKQTFGENVKSNIGYASKKFVGEAIGGIGSLTELITNLPYIGNIAGGALGKTAAKLLPKVEGVEKGFEKILGREFKPTGTISEILGEAAGFGGGLLSLGGIPKAASVAGRAGRTLLATGLPAIASVMTKKGKLPPWVQAGATIGTSLLAHKLTGLNAKQIEKKLYSEARQSAGNSKINARQRIRSPGAQPLSSFEEELRTLREDILVGGTNPSYKDPTVKHINELLDAITKNNGELPVADILRFKENINATRSTFFKRSLTGEIHAPKAKRLINGLNSRVDTFLNRYQNPEFHTAYRTANSIHKGRMDTRKIYEFLSSHAFNKTNSMGIGAGLAYTLINGAMGTLLGKAAPIAAGAQTLAFTNALARNPGLRYALREFLISASKEELKATGKALNNLGKEAKKAKLDLSQYEDVGFSSDE